MLVEAVNGLEIETLGGLDALLMQIHETGAMGLSMRVGLMAVLQIVHLAEQYGTILRVPHLIQADGSTCFAGYVHPITGEVVPIHTLLGDPRRIEFHAEWMPEPAGYSIHVG